MKIRGACSPPTTTLYQVSLVMLVMCEYMDIVCSDQAKSQLGDRRAFWFSQGNALHQGECPTESSILTTFEFK